jgi:hypothetical protein
MCTIVVHPVKIGREKKREEEEEKKERGRKHLRALSRINNKEAEKEKIDKNSSERQDRKKIIIIHPKQT